MINSDSILVSVLMITYNHEPYISEAIEGVLSQNTNFTFELLIGEDNSSDNTACIIREFEIKNPGKIHVYYNSENIGMMNNFSQLILNSSGKYIALCEGDDYWIDYLKLQKQVDFLENNQAYALVHTCKAVRKENEIFQCEVPKIKSGYVFEDIILSPQISVPTILCRADVLKQSFTKIFPLIKLRRWLMADYPLWLDISMKYRIAYLNDVTAVYRFRNESASHSCCPTKQLRFELSIISIKEYFFEVYIQTKKAHNSFRLDFNEMIFHAKKRLILEHGWKARSAIKDLCLTNPLIYFYVLYRKIKRIKNKIT